MNIDKDRRRTGPNRTLNPRWISVSDAPVLEEPHYLFLGEIDASFVLSLQKKNLLWSPPNFSLQPRSQQLEKSRVILCNQDRLEVCSFIYVLL